MSIESSLPLEGVSSTTLRSLAAALRTGQLNLPLSSFAMARVGSCPEPLTAALQRLSTEGLSVPHMAVLLDQCAATVEATLGALSIAELVWTGPELTGAQSRDTAVVIDELFSSAMRTVLVSTFAVHQWERVFRSLASRMDAVPELGVRLFVHVERKWLDKRDDTLLLHEFAQAMRAAWPGGRLPLVYYDPRGLSPTADLKASWHAKCVVVDDDVAFVTSANFTDWAQQRNVEAGALIRSPQFARQLLAQFDGLVQAQAVRRLPGV